MEHAQTGSPRFDPLLQAWVLSNHQDVSQALREPRLAPVGTPPRAEFLAVGDAFAHALSADQLATWRPSFEQSALELAAALPADRPVDLLSSFAVPWALSLALAVTGASQEDAPDLARLARDVFLAAASCSDGCPQREAQAATAELACRLPGAHATINVQAFVALSQTLPHLLSAAWWELFGRPAAAQLARTEACLTTRLVEELLRLAGPARAVFRHALADVDIGRAAIRAGDRVVLLLAAANRDPARFPSPDLIDVDGLARDHLAFGGGLHACSGARLVRMAVPIATEALLRTTATIELLGDVAWLDGFAIRAPVSLPAVLRREPPRVEGDVQRVIARG